MSVREQLDQLTATLPDYKLAYVLAYVQGLVADEEAERADDAYCEQLLKDYQNDPDPHKNDVIPNDVIPNDVIPLEQFAQELGVAL